MGRFLTVTLMATLALFSAGCIFKRISVDPITPSDTMVPVTTPVKAHLKDGSTVVYAKGVQVSDRNLVGAGFRYDIALKQQSAVSTVPLDSVVGMESYQTKVDGVKTAVVSTLVAVAAAGAIPVLAIAIFGSCPTVYSDDGTVEEAELFSNSIAPLFEARDVDRLRAQAGAAGIVRLEVRNEAMETHYLNHLQLLEVRHAADEFVLPDSADHLIVVSGIHTPAEIVSRRGEDLRATLEKEDGVAYRTPQTALESATRGDMEDWIDLTADVAPGASSTALVFRMRNSLLGTTLLYEEMLAPGGARAIDWLGTGLGHISSAVEIGRYYEKRAGLHVEVFRGGSWREVRRVTDSGPISWHDVAAVIPTEPGERTLRVRLKFLSDHWRIDRVGIASTMREGAARPIPVQRVTGSGGQVETEARENLRAPDDRYLQTNPGDRLLLDFDAGMVSPGTSRTFLLSSQGYYTEWIRGEWIRTAISRKTGKEPFRPSDEAVLASIRKWSATRDSFEARFVRDRVPVH